MKQIAWSTPAKRDLAGVFEFYASKNVSVAAQIHDSIIEEADRLASWPGLGQRMEFIDKQNYKYMFRSLVTKDGLYRIIYFVTSETVVIARVWSCRKNPADLRL